MLHAGAYSKDKYLIKSKVPEIEIASPRYVALPLSILSVECVCVFLLLMMMMMMMILFFIEIATRIQCQRSDI